jgi:hypothetical protein
MLGTRPDIAFTVTQMAKFASNPSDEHLNQAIYILHYLIRTHDYALIYDGNSMQAFMSIVTLLMEMIIQIQISNADRLKVTSSNSLTLQPNGTHELRRW